MRALEIVFFILNITILSRASRLRFENFALNSKSASLEQSQTSRQISPEIINDLIEISRLIPKTAIDLIVAEHIVFDINFRRAMNFLKSSKFTTMLDKLQEEPEIVELLDFLQILVPTTSENDLSAPYLEIVLLEAGAMRTQHPKLTKRSAEYEKLAAAIEASNLGSFIGAVRELLVYLPHDEYKNLINKKCQESALFKSFYQALRTKEFRQKLGTALVSKNLAPYVATLNSHSIDVHALVPIAFTVISWGPNV